MKQQIKYILSGETLVLSINNEPYMVTKNHMNYYPILTKLKEGTDKGEELLAMINLRHSIKQKGIDLVDDIFYYNGKEIHSGLTDRILTMMGSGEKGVDTYFKFMENLYMNPSENSIQNLYEFLEACDLPITEDGCFLTYKKVSEEYKDQYTNTLDNSIGKVVEMDRLNVDDDSSKTCSFGLHVCSFEYMKSYSGPHMVICKVHPKDVVAVPEDYNNSKMRVCKYEIIGELINQNQELPKNLISNEDLIQAIQYCTLKTEDYDNYMDNTLEKLDKLINFIKTKKLSEVLIQFKDNYDIIYLLENKHKNTPWRKAVIKIIKDQILT